MDTDAVTDAVSNADEEADEGADTAIQQAATVPTEGANYSARQIVFSVT